MDSSKYWFNPRYQLPSRYYFMYTEIYKMDTESRAHKTQHLGEKTFYACTTDLWTGRATDTFMSLYLLFPYFFRYCNDCCAIIKSWLFVIKHSIIWLKYFILYYLKVTCHCSLFVMLIMVYFYWLLEGYMPVPLFFATLSVFFCCCLCWSTWDYFIFLPWYRMGYRESWNFTGIGIDY